VRAAEKAVHRLQAAQVDLGTPEDVAAELDALERERTLGPVIAPKGLGIPESCACDPSTAGPPWFVNGANYCMKCGNLRGP
jgi:hypothetical protein